MSKSTDISPVGSTSDHPHPRRVSCVMWAMVACLLSPVAWVAVNQALIATSATTLYDIATHTLISVMSVVLITLMIVRLLGPRPWRSN